MKQTYKKKPEYLDAIVVEDDTQSIKDVYEFAGVTNAIITFENGQRIIEIPDGPKVEVGMVLFKDKKGQVVAMPEEKLLSFYDRYTGESENE